jgi:Zn-dependent metalloprotease
MKSNRRAGAAIAGAATAALLATGLASPAAHAAGQRPTNQATARDDAKSVLAAHKPAFRVGAHDSFTPRGAAVLDKDGSAHVRYNRTYQGLPVLGGDLVVHLAKDGAYDGSSVTLKRPLTLGTAAKVSKAAAVRKATSKLEGKVSSTSARKVVDALGSTPALAYEVTVDGVRRDQTPSVLHVVVDAVTGKVLRSSDEIKTAGTGNSEYSGTVSIGTTGSTGNFQMSDPARGNNNTTDLKGATTGNGTLFTDADNVWGNGSTTDRATAGVDAHYGAQVTFDYYKNFLGRNGIFNNGTGVRSRVHYGNSYINAFWDGTQMTYGDGSGNTHPLTEIDVAGHEMSHGVTENTANLDYSGESGGLNEATSDIFGTAVEFYANNSSDVGDYLIGEKININGDGTPLRYMDKPSRDGGSPDCWSSGIGNLDVHYSSGPANHVFYLMSEGSGAKTINGVSYNSPTCNGSTVTGITRDVAAKIWYRALSVYMTSSTNYAGARTAAINAAKDLYGATSAQCAGVESAFSAISVSGTTCGGTTPPPTGTNKIANPGFESGAASWTQTTGVITNDATKAHAGAWLGWLNGYGTAHTDSLSQSVVIPAATSANLSLWLKVTSAETSTTTAYDTLKVQVVSGSTTTTLATYSNVNKGTTYVQKSLNMTPYVGKTVTVKVVGVEDASLATSFYVDDLSLTTA